MDEETVAPRSIWLPGAGIRMHALDWGPQTAPRLVLLLHGVGGNAHIWDAVSKQLRKRLGAEARIVALDGRDGGLTEHPRSGYAVDDFGADIASVHDALGRPPLTLVGHSRGGWLAAWFAEREVGRVDRLVLVDPARFRFTATEAADRFFGWVRAGLGPFESEEAAIAWAREEDPDADWNAHRRAGFLANFRRRDDGSLVGHLPLEAVDQLRAGREQEDVVGSRLGDIACPTLLLIGTRQSDARLGDKLAYGDGISDCRVVLLSGSHFLHTDLPDTVAAAIAEFASVG